MRRRRPSQLVWTSDQDGRTWIIWDRRLVPGGALARALIAAHPELHAHTGSYRPRHPSDRPVNEADVEAQAKAHALAQASARKAVPA